MQTYRQVMYEPLMSLEEEPRYSRNDLESLSVSAFYGFRGFDPKDLMPSQPMRLDAGPRGFKIFSNESTTPLVRLDYPAHHGLPETHLQYGGKGIKGYNPERSGNEAAEILAHILKLNTKIVFPGNDEDQ